MSTATDRVNSGLVDDYRERVHPNAFAGAHSSAPRDELIDALSVEPGVAELAARVDRLGPAGLRSRRAAVRRFVQDDGVTYGVANDPHHRMGWSLDPLPVVITATEWADLQAGLQQRALLLDLLLADIYGPRRLITEGIIPAGVVLGHPGFLPAADGCRLPGPHQLVLPSMDLARDADGGWTVISDRAQAPSGAGYAMADRRIIARTLPGFYRETPLARLRGFFDQVRDALTSVAPAGDEPPRVVLLSPGPGSETWFDQAFMSTLLGMPLVQSEDLTMRDGRVWLRTTGRLERVDVILRRVDGAWSDPLDIRSDSRLGVPGLIEASRRGLVSVVNPVGSAVLENSGLLPYLGSAARVLLDQELMLPGARTWWCGDPDQARQVMDRLDQLVIKPLNRDGGDTTVLGWECDAQKLGILRAKIAAEPWLWSVQEPVHLSTAPVVTNDGLAPRRLVLRAFGVGGESGYQFMPGGLARVSTDATNIMVANSLGGQAKDVWVLSSEDSSLPTPGHGRQWDVTPLPGMAGAAGLAPRLADDLFWLGRYAERADGGARLAIVADDLIADNLRPTPAPGAAATAVIVAAIGDLTAVQEVQDAAAAQDAAAGARALRTLLTDDKTLGTIGYSVNQAVRAAHAVRELLSVDTWLVLSRLSASLEFDPQDDAPLQPVLSQVLESLIALAGLGAESMVRDLTWAYMDAGRRIERAQYTVQLLSSTIAQERPPVTDGQVTEAALRATDSAITHRRRLAAGVGPASPMQSALELLLLDPTNPRSVAFQLEKLDEAMRLATNDEVISAIAAIQETLRDVDVDAVQGDRRAGLRSLLSQLSNDLRSLSNLIERVHFVRQAPQISFQSGPRIGREGVPS